MKKHGTAVRTGPYLFTFYFLLEMVWGEGIEVPGIIAKMTLVSGAEARAGKKTMVVGE